MQNDQTRENDQTRNEEQPLDFSRIEQRSNHPHPAVSFLKNNWKLILGIIAALFILYWVFNGLFGDSEQPAANVPATADSSVVKPNNPQPQLTFKLIGPDSVHMVVGDTIPTDRGAGVFNFSGRILSAVGPMQSNVDSSKAGTYFRTYQYPLNKPQYKVKRIYVVSDSIAAPASFQEQQRQAREARNSARDAFNAKLKKAQQDRNDAKARFNKKRQK